MRTITSHIVNPANDTLAITVVDEPGSGGANHAYVIVGSNPGLNPSINVASRFANDIAVADRNAFPVCLFFQNGPIDPVRKLVNGLTHEALLAILADRLTGFQAGPYACDDNALALAHIEAAQACLQRRTRERMSRGVEGTHQL